MQAAGPSLAGAVFRILRRPGRSDPRQGDGGIEGPQSHAAGRARTPVPPGFVLGTGICRDYLKHGAAALTGLPEVLEEELQQLAIRTGRRFGDAEAAAPGVGAGSGAAISMPGMMETVLNIGLNEATLRALIRMTGNPRLAYDCRRRLVQQYAEVVHAVAPARFDARRDAMLADLGLSGVAELDTGSLAGIAAAFVDEFETATGKPFPPIRSSSSVWRSKRCSGRG